MIESNFAEQRRMMVDRQLRRRGIDDPRVLAAMEAVPREEFVPADLRDRAYEDGALPIGFGQTISQPYVVAFMAAAASIQPTDRVLEIGGGCGYAAAVLGELAREVHSRERIPELAEPARERLQRLGYENVFTHLVDGSSGWESHAPFAAILVPAAAKEVPEPLKDQLAEGGRLIIPLGDHQHGQCLMRYTLQGRTLVFENLGPFAFVPLITSRNQTL